jgi:sigma-B regulation protein RsbU (phosphoserine phosphatase)
VTVPDERLFPRMNELLAEMPGRVLQQIGGSIQEIRVKEGTSVFREGDEGDAVYFVVEGRLAIEKNGVKLLSRSEGECVGELALIDEGPRSASVVAETDALLQKWERADFQRTLAASPELANRILRILVRKLRQDVSLQLEASLERERWQHDLKRAHEIQMAMLPEGDFSTGHLEIAGYCCPAAAVGGDYYDYLPLGSEKLALIIADVMGRGFYSGLLVAMAKSCVHTQAGIDHSPDKVMQAMNRTISFSVQSGLLMSCCYLVLDRERKVLAYTNAGHPYPYVYRKRGGRLDKLSSTDPLLGVPILKAARFTRKETPWEAGDLLLLYSDGVTEAQDASGIMFGDERLEEILMENGDKAPAEVRDRILTALSDYCGKLAQEDDMTVVVARAR